MAVKNCTELFAWQKAMELALKACQVTAGFPHSETYGLASQMRQAAVSVPSNVAEGQGRWSTNEFLHHLSVAHGSLRELEAQTVLSGRLGFLASEEIEEVNGPGS